MPTDKLNFQDLWIDYKLESKITLIQYFPQICKLLKSSQRQKSMRTCAEWLRPFKCVHLAAWLSSGRFRHEITEIRWWLFVWLWPKENKPSGVSSFPYPTPRTTLTQKQPPRLLRGTVCLISNNYMKQWGDDPLHTKDRNFCTWLLFIYELSYSSDHLPEKQ